MLVRALCSMDKQRDTTFHKACSAPVCFIGSSLKKVGKRKTKAVARLSLKSLGWDDEHSKGFYSLQQQLQMVVKTAHCSHKMQLCVHRDASDASARAACIHQWPVQRRAGTLDNIREGGICGFVDDLLSELPARMF